MEHMIGLRFKERVREKSLRRGSLISHGLSRVKGV